jgi:hypothetical protein
MCLAAATYGQEDNAREFGLFRVPASVFAPSVPQRRGPRKLLSLLVLLEVLNEDRVAISVIVAFEACLVFET